MSHPLGEADPTPQDRRYAEERYEAQDGGERYEVQDGGDAYDAPQTRAETYDRASAADEQPVPVGDGQDRTVREPSAGTEGQLTPEWLQLQSTFVDDPRAAVEGAADLVERQLRDLRGRLTRGESTEDLRTAFRQLRDLHRTLR